MEELLSEKEGRYKAYFAKEARAKEWHIVNGIIIHNGFFLHQRE